jgi:hypothetical protein
MNDEREANREFVERWKVAGPMLAAVHKAELRALDDHFDYELIDALLDAGIAGSRHLPPRTTSGLVEFQRLMMRSRR